MPEETFHSSTSWEALLPAHARGHIWTVTKNVSLTLALPDRTTRTFQERTCAALKLRADSLVLTTEETP
jgi:hypothetical protein